MNVDAGAYANIYAEPQIAKGRAQMNVWIAKKEREEGFGVEIRGRTAQEKWKGRSDGRVGDAEVWRWRPN
jgi:hypothetical protein